MKKNTLLILKSILCLLIALTVIYSSALFDKNDVYDYSVSSLNDEVPLDGNAFVAGYNESIFGTFSVPHSNLSTLKVLVWNFEASSPANMVCMLLDGEGTEIDSVKVPLDVITERSWCTFNFDTEVIADAEYTVKITTDSPDSYVELIKTNYDTPYNPDGPFTLVISTVSYDVSFAPMRVVFYVFELLFIALVISVLTFSVFNFEKLYRFFTESVSKKGILPAAVVSALLVFMSDPLNPSRLVMTDAVGQIGFGVSRNYDYDAAITELGCVFIVFVFSFCLLFLFFNKLFGTNKGCECEKAYKLLNSFSVVALSFLLLYSIQFFSAREKLQDSFSYSLALIALFSVYEIIYCLTSLNRKLEHSAYIRLFFVTFAASFLVYPLLSSLWGGGRLSIIVLTVMLSAQLLVIAFSSRDGGGKSLVRVVDFLSPILAFSPLFVSLFIESVHILNGNKIFISSPTATYAITLSVIVFVLAALAVLGLRCGYLKLAYSERFFIPVLLVGLAFLSVQPALSQTLSISIFEDANYTVLASDFLNYGKIPIVEHYGAHMLESVFESISWMLLNDSDVLFANQYVQSYLGIESIKLFTPLVIFIAYCFLAKFCDRKNAFFITVLLPTVNIFGYFAVGLIPVFALTSYIKKRTPARALLLWICCAMVAIYRLDIGMAFGVATVSVLVIYLVKSRQKKEIKHLVLTFLSVVGFFAVLWVVLCLVKDVNPIYRLKEFLSISLSNYNWAHANLGNTELALFAVAYLLLPLSMAILLLYVLLSKKCGELTDEKRIILLALAVSYFANFSRSCVRHSAAELSVHVIFWTALVFVAVLVCEVFDKKAMLAPVLAFGLLASMLLTGNGRFVAGNTVDGISVSYGDAVSTWQKDGSREDISYWEELKENETVVDRVVLPDSINEIYKPCEIFFGEFMREGETFLDFANCSHIYAMLGLENPVYVSQSPLQLTDEFSQRMFVEQAKSKIENIPFALMPYDINSSPLSSVLDGLPNSYRYYRVSEFIYQNYRPLSTVGSLAVWVRVDLYDEIMPNVEAFCTSDKSEFNFEIISDEYYKGQFIQHVASLPYLFGKYEKPENEITLSTVSSYDGKIYQIDAPDIELSDGGVYLKFTAEYHNNESRDDLKKNTVSVHIGGAVESEKELDTARIFMVDIHEGKNVYYIRISADYSFVLGDFTHIDIESNADVRCSALSVVTFE